MTQDSTDNLPQVIEAEVVAVEEKELSFDDKARALLPDSEYKSLVAYMEAGKPELALSTANSFFELFLNGVDVDDIHKLNPAFPKSVIHWSRIKYNWDKMLKEHIFKIQQRIADKVMKAQLEATSLYADVISAAHKKHGVNLKKYLQTGDESYLKKTGLDISSIHQLQKAVEGLQKVTNQDKNFKVTEEKNLNVSLDIKGNQGDLSPEGAAKILAVVAEEARKKDLIKQKG